MPLPKRLCDITVANIICVHCRLNTDSPSVGSTDNQTYGQYVDVPEMHTSENVESMFSDEIQR